MGAPRVSIILIFLNGEAFLDAAIESVMAQSFTDFELLLCDDGSGDAATSIARGWATRHPGKISYLEHEGHANHGMSATRNLGLAASRGEFVAFIDADDVWRPNKLTDQVEIMEAHPELGMVCGVVNYWSSWAGETKADVLIPTGHVQNTVVHPPGASLALYPLGKAAAPCPSDMLLRHTAVDAVGRFEAHFTGPRQMYEDQGFLAKLYLESPVYFSDKIWLDYRRHAASYMAEVKRAGRYDEVRSYFLTWFDGYLRTHPALESDTVRLALNRALWPYRYPLLHRIIRKLRKLRSSAAKFLRGGEHGSIKALVLWLLP
jgi:glycosyltransferase involved in cell wall biosynthesis